MTFTTTRTMLGLVAATAVIIVAGGGGAYATAQDQNTNPTARPFMGRHGGPGGRGGLMGPMGMLPRLGRALQLTDAQRDQIKAIAASHRDEWQALGTRARTAHQALQAATTANTIDDTLIRQKSADVAAVDADLAVTRAHAYAEVLQVLTADQKSKLNELKAHIQARMKNRAPQQ
jgi:periplasmic protein CpxP/Spy